MEGGWWRDQNHYDVRSKIVFSSTIAFCKVVSVPADLG